MQSLATQKAADKQTGEERNERGTQGEGLCMPVSACVLLAHETIAFLFASLASSSLFSCRFLSTYPASTSPTVSFKSWPRSENSNRTDGEKRDVNGERIPGRRGKGGGLTRFERARGILCKRPRKKEKKDKMKTKKKRTRRRRRGRRAEEKEEEERRRRRQRSSR